MELSWIILQQTLRMALYMAMGYLLYKLGKISIEGSKTLANLLLWLVIPATILNGFCVDRTPERMSSFAVSFLLGAMALSVALLVSRILLPKRGIEQFAAAFSNAGYIGIPLIQAAFGSNAVFHLVGMILMLNVMQWTYGAHIIRKETIQNEAEPMRIGHMLLNPIVVSALVGMCIFFGGLGSRLPQIASECIEGVAALNAPLAMIVLGVYLAQTNIRSLFTTGRLYWVSTVRLIIIPMLTLATFALIPTNPQLKMTILIAAAAPAGANTAVYAQLYGGDYAYACKAVTHSTILSIFLLPIYIMIARLWIGT